MGIAMRRLAAMAAASAALALAACSTAPTDPALAAAQQGGALPPLVPMRRFVANIDYVDGHALSPDGSRLLWARTVGTDIGLAVRATTDAAVLSGPGVKTFATGTLARPGVSGPTYSWLPDSRHIAYLKDFSGDENTQLFVLDSENPAARPWAVTPWPGVRSAYVARGAPGSARFYFSNNGRDRSSMDLFEADAATRTIREVARSEADGRVLAWFIGTDRQLAGRTRQLGSVDGSDVAVELRNADGSWRLLRTVKAFDFFWPHRIDPEAGRLWAMTNMGRDKGALVEIDLASGRERVLAEDAEVDLDYAQYPPLRGAPYGYAMEAGRPRFVYLDAALGAEVAQAVATARSRGWLDAEPVLTRPSSSAEDAGRLVLRAVTGDESVEMLLDRPTGQLTRLTPPRKPDPGLFAPMEPFAFKTSDGLTVHGYVVRPRGVQGPAPLVVDIHGGPWARDDWQPAGYTTTQMLANRGYAVLKINYRGSTGYGRAFMLAGAHEYNGRMQRDIAEGVQWAIDQGIADRQRMAVFGASFGGFSVLAQLIQKPHDYRCGIDVVGVANWPRVIESWPPFWRNRHYFAMTYGDVAKPDERAAMLANSPISQIDRITAPLLVIHGSNDVRVLRQDSDDVVAELKRLGRPVQYMTFADEGHSVRKWRNRLALWREVEDTLATCLGGRSNGFDYYQLMPR
ncbi:prolyl oligopeptidase family serine peptidase [Variovorax sp. J22P271]|uniref:alpha/beta hydrolase family protein n=1 Tax=Variovorax davisae TaxID=3053515 RepID=UPI002574E167|nr:prolyl oligopeptidase family serine peptidase [Variovorax sp. J22P271]MDM0036077.1 prolyl oligopeptidase family serine peptidase [Variovorax sp. J22P271]